MFALHGECGSLLATKEMMKLCVSNVKSKNKQVSKAASGALTTLVDHEDARFLAADEGLDKSMTTLISDKSLGVVTKRNCVVYFCRDEDVCLAQRVRFEAVVRDDAVDAVARAAFLVPGEASDAAVATGTFSVPSFD